MIRGDVRSYADFCRLMADENRLRILFSLEGGQKSVSSVIEITKLSQTLVSYHLRTLREKGLVKTERKGPFVLYSLTNEDVLTWVFDSRRFFQPYETDKGSVCMTPKKVCNTMQKPKASKSK